MTTVETRYDLGDVAYGVRTQTAQRRPKCPLCEGTGRVPVAVDGAARTATCPDCHGRCFDQDDTHIAEQRRDSIYRLTIGEVRWSTREGAAYMAEETGLGSGSLWREEQLYKTRRDALAASAEADVVFAWVGNQQSVLRGDVDWEPFS